MKFCRSFVQDNGMFLDIHINKKSFYMTKIKENYYLLPDEKLLERSTKSKRFITKVMFMTVVTRPRYYFAKKLLFDGEVGIQPFVYQKAAKCNSKKRIKGTMETKAVSSIKKDVV